MIDLVKETLALDCDGIGYIPGEGQSNGDYVKEEDMGEIGVRRGRGNLEPVKTETTRGPRMKEEQTSQMKGE